MADEPNFDPIKDSLAEGGLEIGNEKPKEFRPSYKMMPDSKIPVSKALGKLWKSRKDQAWSKLKDEGILDAWRECIGYYNSDQVTDEAVQGSPKTSRMARKGTGQSDEHIETENIVFANTTALVPATYAKNPDVEITPNDKQNEETVAFATCAERVVNTLFGMKQSPGINLKPKVRKCVVMTTLTNISYIEIGWNDKNQSSEATIQEIQLLADKLAQTKKLQEIEEIEGQLEALEQKVDILKPSGPFAKFRHPKDVLRDPSNQSSDLTECNWIMIADYVRTNLLRAIYYEKDKETDEYKSIFKPTHVLKAGGSQGHDLTEEVNNFSIVGDSKDYKHYGYEDEETFNKSCFSKVWYVWDKITRRCFLFADNDWSWPIWVWDDPYKLTRFFPIYCLEFYTDPEGDYARSEVMYYLDQQDAINEIASERRRAINWARKNIFYDLDAFKDSGDAINAFLNGGDNSGAIGVKLPQDKKMQDVVFSVPPPSAAFMQLFDTAPYLQAIDRVSSVTNVMRGVEYKTNTTNKAIESYESQTQTRLDEKIDQIEEFVGDIGQGLIELCIQKMEPGTIAELVEDGCAEIWAHVFPMQPKDFAKKFSFKIVGGSALKPTARAKKEEAIQVGQVLGQFGKSMPAAVLVMMRVFERAFDEITITQEDWAMLRGSIEQQLMPEQQPPADAGPSGDQLAEMEMMINQLPPQAKDAIGKAMAKGVPIRQAVEQVMMRVEANQNQQRAVINGQPSGTERPN